MPTPYSAMATVASSLAGIDPNSAGAVERFYTETFPEYSETTRDLIFEWLAATVDDPSPTAVSQLVRAIEADAQAGDVSAPARAVDVGANLDEVNPAEDQAPIEEGPMYR